LNKESWGGEPTPDELKTKVASLRAQLTDAMNERNHLAYELNEIVKRLRTNVKGQFGDDSSGYGMVGLTRLSERKRPTTKK